LKNFNREDLSFSLCGLNCALCTMKIDGHCPGCGGGAGNQGCPIARCSIEHGGYEYCFECESYPCPKYDGITPFDSFITHRNQISDMEKIKSVGIAAYRLELEKKAQILQYLLDNFNDGRRKTFFCLAINLFDLSNIVKVVEQIKERITREMTVKEKASIAVECFEAVAKEKDIVLKMNKKTSKVK
jgi:hypothetical protein